MNKAIIIGNMVADPEIHEFSSGNKNCNFRLAVQRNYKSQGGTYDSDFLNIVCWRQTADFVGKYCHKGSRLAVEGSIQTRSYDGSDGNKKYVTEILADRVENLTPRSSGTDNAHANSGFEQLPDTDGLPF